MVRLRKKSVGAVVAKATLRKKAICVEKTNIKTSANAAKITTNQASSSPAYITNGLKNCCVKLRRIKLPTANAGPCLNNTTAIVNNADVATDNPENSVRPGYNMKSIRKCRIMLRRFTMTGTNAIAAREFDCVDNTAAQANGAGTAAGNVEKPPTHNTTICRSIKTPAQNQRIRSCRVKLRSLKVPTVSNNAKSDEQKIPDEVPGHKTTQIVGAVRTPLLEDIEASGRERNISRKEINRQVIPITRKFVNRLNLAGKEGKSSENNNNADQVYDFLSDSQTSGYDANKHSDPAADIVQQMIKDGKVRVATIRKGTGKPVLKHNVKGKNPKGTSRKAIKSIRNKKKAIEPALKNPEQIDNPHGQTVNNQTETPPSDSTEINAHQTERTDGPEAMTSTRHFEGGFSEFARSVLVQQLRKQKRHLLEVAKKFVSTPLNKNVAPPLPQAENISPIAATEKMHVSKSLWGTEALNEAPSTSANVPLSPASLDEPISQGVENAPTLLSNSSLVFSLPQIDEESVDGNASPSHFDELSEPRSTSQLPPMAAAASPPRTFEQKTVVGNASPWRVAEETHLPGLFNFKLNPENVPSFSSDFLPASPKKINQNKNKKRKLREHGTSISSRVHADCDTSISSYASNDSNAENVPPVDAQASAFNNSDANADIFNRHEHPNPRQKLSNRSPLKAINIIEVVTLHPPKHQRVIINGKDACSYDKPNSNIEKEGADLFGFEELLDTNEEQSAITETPQVRYAQKSLHDKLINLKKWRPVRDEMPTSSTARIAPVFDDDMGKPKMRTIKEMLCSTMKNSEKPHGGRNAVMMSDQTEAAADLSELFKDPDPETSFDEKSVHRTYNRQTKKKRKLRENVVMFFDSDESGEDDDQKDSSPTKQHKKRGRKEDLKTSAELEEFARTFNEMCEEVDKFELIVEKSN